MRYGTPYAAGWGNPENHFVYAYPGLTEMVSYAYTAVPFRWKLRANWGNAFVQIYRNGKLFGTYWTPEGVEVVVLVDVPYGSQSTSLLALRIGALNDPSYECNRVARAFEATENKRVSISLTFEPKIVEPEFSGGTYTSNWTLAGLEQAKCASVADHSSWGRLTYTIAVAGGNATVSAYSSGTLVAEGTAAIGGAPFLVTLAEQNDSGISGSVTVDNTVAAVTDGILDIRWPVSIKIKRDTTNPPTTVVATVLFDGRNEIRWTEPTELAAGTYYYRAQAVSDTGQDGTETATQTVSTIASPAAPTGLVYSSGDAAALVIGYSRSSTAGATYRLYLATAIGGVMNLNDPIATAPAGTPGEATTLAVGTGITGSPGKAYLVLRAVSGGVEERNLNVLEVEFDGAGAYVAPRPNVPGFNLASVAITSGRSLSLRAVYNASGQRGVATQLKLFSRTPGGSYNYASPDDTQAIVATGRTGLSYATLAKTFSSNGYYYVRVLAETAGGVQSDPTAAPEALVFVSDEALPAPTGFEVELSRS